MCNLQRCELNSTFRVNQLEVHFNEMCDIVMMILLCLRVRKKKRVCCNIIVVIITNINDR
jgi:hypothetical protein